MWLGITDDLHEGLWKWDDSAPTTTTTVPAGLVNWALHEPNNWDNEDHGTLYVEPEPLILAPRPRPALDVQRPMIRIVPVVGLVQGPIHESRRNCCGGRRRIVVPLPKTFMEIVGDPQPHGTEAAQPEFPAGDHRPVNIIDEVVWLRNFSFPPQGEYNSCVFLHQVQDAPACPGPRSSVVPATISEGICF